jgi:hypothetical protein
MIKANQKEAPAGELNLGNGEAFNAMLYNLQFPLDVKAVAERKQRKDLEQTIRNAESNINDYRIALTALQQSRKTATLQLAEMGENAEDRELLESKAKAELESVAALPWVQSVRLDGNSLKLQTRAGMLKTVLQKRIVDFGKGVYRTEFLEEPVTVNMPEYEIHIGMEYMGSDRFANNGSAVCIQLYNSDNISTYIGGKLFGHTPYPHWAGNDGRGHRRYTSLCLGEYAPDLNEASKKSLVEFCSALATYLQMSGDEHAYRRKEIWALTLGNPEYNEFVYREARKDETPEMVEKLYARDFRILNQVDFPENAVVNPGESVTMTASNIDIVATQMRDASYVFSDVFARQTVPRFTFGEAVDLHEDDDDGYRSSCSGDDCDDDGCDCRCHD